MGSIISSISDWVYMKKNTCKKLTPEQHENILSEFEKVLNDETYVSSSDEDNSYIGCEEDSDES